MVEKHQDIKKQHHIFTIIFQQFSSSWHHFSSRSWYVASATNSATAARQSPCDDSAEQKMGCAALRRVSRAAARCCVRRKAWNKVRPAVAEPPRDVLKRDLRWWNWREFRISPRFLMVKSNVFDGENPKKWNLGWMDSDIVVISPSKLWDFISSTMWSTHSSHHRSGWYKHVRTSHILGEKYNGFWLRLLLENQSMDQTKWAFEAPSIIFRWFIGLPNNECQVELIKSSDVQLQSCKRDISRASPKN